MQPVHVSTLGMSVYNALSLSGRDMPPSGILDFLRSSWAPDLEAVEVDMGIAFLLERGLVRLGEAEVVIEDRDPRTCRGRQLKRLGDGTELGF
ncbi:MAG TPA: hypothetical protein VFW03_23205 [Gemmatimonadaceae bacterium]|nr:hypothetical protein [Gemmatimonadaceae bacterium]